MWLKKIIAFSATVTGGYFCFASTNICITFCTTEEKQHSSNGEDSSYICFPEDTGVDLDKDSLTFRRHTSIPLYWKLLLLSKSKDQKIRHRAVRSISRIPYLEKWEYVMVAQACDPRTSIGLSRNVDTSPHLFLPPPFKDLDGENLQKELFDYVSSLPGTNDDFIENLKRQVSKLEQCFRKNEFCVDLDIGDPSVLFHSQQKKKLVSLFYKNVLQIFRFYTSESTYRSTIVQKGILKLLLKILYSCANEPQILSLIGQILANIAMEETFTKDIYLTGWIGILASWAKSSDIAISLPAAKALANLDKDDIFHSMYDDGIYLLNPLFRHSGEKEPIADIIFVHGLLGATFWTWRQRDTKKIMPGTEDLYKKEDIYIQENFSLNYSMCWPKDWLYNDVPNIRILSVDYKTCVSNWSSQCFQDKEKNNITEKSTELIRKLLLSKVGDRPLIWIAHSMGGLIVKQILTDAVKSEDKNIKSLAQKTRGIIFFSVPHKGSELVAKINSASHIFLPSGDVAQLGKEAPNLLLLHENFRKTVFELSIPVLSFGETKATHWGLGLSVLVPPDSADPGVGEFFTLPCDHLSTCKPESLDSFEYLEILKFLQRNLSEAFAEKFYLTSRSLINVFDVSKLLSLIP